MKDCLPYLLPSRFPALQRHSVQTLQLNLGYLCNQRCLHCHVNAGPTRTELMSREVMLDVLHMAARLGVETLDLTGGAPEMNPSFRFLVEQAKQQGLHVIDRCNLTILTEPSYEYLVDFMADHHVEVVASLPCYLEDNVDRQRGDGVFEKSLVGLQRLNQRGYGTNNPELPLRLVFNPQADILPPAQDVLQASYKKELLARYDVSFDHLLTITNMPIKRFGSTLLSQGRFKSYIELLKEAYRSENLASVMCRSMLSIDWQGYVYDCDFNQMLGLKKTAQQLYIADIDVAKVQKADIAVADHCYACTAGQGSSCGGAL